MSQIRVTAEELKSRGLEFATHSETMSELVEALGTLFENLQNEWEGDASASFASAWEQLQPGIANVVTLLSDTSEAIIKVAEAYAEADSSTFSIS